MVLADLTEPENRANALSKIGICFGVGMIAGSTIGGNLNTMFGWVWTGFAEFRYWGLKSLMLKVLWPRRLTLNCYWGPGSLLAKQLTQQTNSWFKTLSALRSHSPCSKDIWTNFAKLFTVSQIYLYSFIFQMFSQGDHYCIRWCIWVQLHFIVGSNVYPKKH